MPLTIIRNDITKMNVDAIVNAANTELMAGGGVCGAIFAVAGEDYLQKACSRLAPIKTGEAVITRGYSLLAKYIIHAAGPVYKDGNQGEESQLQSCYMESLNLAKKHKCKSIAFPLISSGIYGYPKADALNTATRTIKEWLTYNDLDVFLVVFDKAAFMISNDLLGNIKAFIDENYVDERSQFYESRYQLSQDRRIAYDSEELHQTAKLNITEFSQALSDDSIMENAALSQMARPYAFTKKLNVKLDEPFTTTLLRLIDSKDKTDVEIYKRANLDRKHFSKIRKGKGYMPSKKTIVALAIALELSMPETNDLLKRAGFALSRSVVFDVIIEYFITNKMYDIFDINNVLFEYDQQLLGG